MTGRVLETIRAAGIRRNAPGPRSWHGPVRCGPRAGWIRGVVRVGLLLWVSVGVVAAQVDARPPEAKSEPRARLALALDAYATAQAETDRDARLAGFARAEQLFAALVAEGFESVALYTNLGNAALQAAHPGRAVLAFRRALVLDPSAQTARQNLAHFRSQLPKWVPIPEQTEGARALLFYRGWPTTERSMLAAGSFALAALSFAIAVRRRQGAWRGFGYFALAVWALLLASVVFDARGERREWAVVMVDETLARSADSSLAPLALPEPLPAGVEVERLEVRGEWARIRLANGRDVWVRESSVTPIAD